MTVLSDYAALPAGQTIGRYEIQAILGQGGFGITYRARDAQLGRDVAIKEYLPSALAVRQNGTTVLPRSTKVAEDFNWGRERFVAEGRTLATLQRAPGIVRVFDFLEANGTAYIVMELVPGDTLEAQLKQRGKLKPGEVDRILWPLLDGLERVHATGFLHRDIKPANILLDADGNPTLIDFGASRAAVADRNTAMTAVFTPGYAAAEQFTSAKQGPWTDIYSLSATIYHAITGAPPPSAFDRMLDDAYRPLGKLMPAGFAPGLLVGIDAGLAVRASDRPQSIAGWRAILAHAGTTQDGVTVVMTKPVTETPTSPAPHTGRRQRFRLGRVALIVLAVIGGTYLVARPDRAGPGVTNTEEARRKAEADQAKERRKQAEEQREAAAEQAEQQRKQEEALREARRKAADMESALNLSTLDRQRGQVALTALGFDTGGTDGTFGTRTREMIAAWQRAHGESGTGFLSGRQNQALLKEAAPAVSRFDEERRVEEARKRAEDEKVKAPPPSPTVPAAPTASATPDVAAATPRLGHDGLWRGSYYCSPSRLSGEFTVPLQVRLVDGTGRWARPGATLEKGGIQWIMVKVTGAEVLVQRAFVPVDQPGRMAVATMAARYDGNTITGAGQEENSGGRTCNISLTRAQ